jgi:hypothetical protein
MAVLARVSSNLATDSTQLQRCNKSSVYTERPTSPLVKEKAPFLNSTCLGKNKNTGHGSWGDLTPGINVLTRPAAI